MGVWGTKIGDSDQALDIISMCYHDENYHKAELNRTDVAYYSNYENVLCAIALVDVSINGFEPEIWSNYVIKSEDYMKYISLLEEYSPRWEMLDDAIKRLTMLKYMENGFEGKDKIDREHIMNLLEERLVKARAYINNALVQRKNKLLNKNNA